jgi:hypothetical protein
MRSVKKYTDEDKFGPGLGKGKDVNYLLAQLSNADKAKSSKDVAKAAIAQKYSKDKEQLQKHMFDSLVNQQTEKALKYNDGGNISDKYANLSRKRARQRKKISTAKTTIGRAIHKAMVNNLNRRIENTPKYD